MGVLVTVGTAKGLFLFRSDASRQQWQVEGPHFKGWKVTATARDREGRYFVGTSSYVYGAAIQRSADLQQWEQIADGPQYPEGGERKLNQIWRLCCDGDVFYAGVDEAGAFSSRDGGDTWQPLDGLNEHSTRAKWFPGNGGLCAHALLVDPARDRLFCGISAVGVFRSDDGGKQWRTKNSGVQVIIEDKEHKDIGFCVHGLAQDPDDPDKIWRQEHTGMFRSRDGGDSWERIDNGLPSRFGFPITLDAATKSLYCVPLESDEYRIPNEGKLRVYRSRDEGDSWQPLDKGLPTGFYAGVLRGALAVDQLSPCGVYMGSTAGTVHISRDGGDSWTTLPYVLPRILTVEVFME